jgi:transcriptional regulator with XRE-family HTH domain
MVHAAQKKSTLGQKLNQLRNTRELTQEEVSNGIGVARSSYAHYENDRFEPDIRTLKALSALYEVSVDTLINCDNQSLPKLQNKLFEYPVADFNQTLEEIEHDNHRLRENVKELKKLLRDTVNVITKME